jgi:uncharacterized protein YraI
MDSKFGFNRMTVAEFETWIASTSVSRMVDTVQQHHTWSPNYASFGGSNHFAMQKAMRDYHVNVRKWADIGQNLSIFPDGMVLTGRPMNLQPACIYGNNPGAICIENVGDFDAGKDRMTPAQRDAIVHVTAALCKRFSIPVTTDGIVYHHWFDLDTGARRNGAGNTKSCPGTAFFGGNKVADCKTHFLPLVSKAMGLPAGPAAALAPVPPPLGYARVTADSLNVRQGPGSRHPLATDLGAMANGVIARVYATDNNWLKVSHGKEHWIAGRFTEPVRRMRVNADETPVMDGPGSDFQAVSALPQGAEVFVDRVEGAWSSIANHPAWVETARLA